MMGREAYANPYVLAEVDRQFYQATQAPRSREQVLLDYLDYVDANLAKDLRLNTMSRHLVGLYHGEPRSRLWRRHISENAHKPGADSGVLREAWSKMVEAPDGALA
jgi:tRNA-dihydrouridine synthase A